jgi:stage V sporulation protein D (sporulation-specific penicillin-binding protein)
MLADILPYLGVRAEYSESEGAQRDAVMPQTVGEELDEAAEAVLKAGLRYRTIGEGSVVTAQLPAPHYEIARGSEVILYLGAEISNEKESVPNLIGMRYNDARDTLSRLGIYIHSLSAVLDGESQCVGTQSLGEGALAVHGSVIEVSLLSSDDEILGRY